MTSSGTQVTRNQQEIRVLKAERSAQHSRDMTVALQCRSFKVESPEKSPHSYNYFKPWIFVLTCECMKLEHELMKFKNVLVINKI